MKHFLGVGLVLSLSFITFSADCQVRWKMFSELSPVSRSANDRVLHNPQSFNLEWRNKLGFRLDNQTFAGASLSLRHYNLTESAVTDLSNPPLNLNYQLNNTLLGGGIFITRFLRIKPNLFLHATAFGMVEQGRGKFSLTYETPICQNCFEPDNGIPLTQGGLTAHKTTFRERNKYAGIEVGSNFYVFPKIALFTSLTLLQYEVYNISNDQPDFQANFSSDMRRPLDQKGNSFDFFTDRPVFHFGVLMHMNY